MEINSFIVKMQIEFCVVLCVAILGVVVNIIYKNYTYDCMLK